jgi:hypothetical protein
MMKSKKPEIARVVIPANTGILIFNRFWAPLFAGVTNLKFFTKPSYVCVL